MANTKISALPSYTGTAADLRWFVMNNSGETETFKFSGYSTSLTFGSGTDSIKSTNATTASGTNSISIGKGAAASGNDAVCIGNSSSTDIGTESIAIGKHPGLGSTSKTISIGSGAYNNTQFGIAIGFETSAQNNGICIGSNTTRATGSNSVSFGNAIENNIGINSVVIGYDNRAGLSPTFNGNPYGVVIGSGHRVDNTGFYNTILGGASTTITGTSNTFIGNGVGLTSVREGDIIINSSGNTITGTGGYKISIGGFGNTISGSGTFGTIINGNSNSITGGINNSILGGQGNTNSSTRGTILGGINNQHSGTNGVVLGGEGNNATGWIASVGGYNSTASAEIGFVYGNQCIGQGQTIGIVGAEHGRTLGSTYRSFIGGGLYNWMTDATNSAMIGGMNNTITGGTNVAMIGCSGRTADADNTTYVENLQVLRQAKYGNFNNGSRATNYTIDWNNGNIQKVVLTGSCVFSATNITDGTTYIFKVSQDNSGNRAATWSSGIFKFANSTPPTLSTGANAVDIFTFVAMDGLLYGVAQLNFG